MEETARLILKTFFKNVDSIILKVSEKDKKYDAVEIEVELDAEAMEFVKATVTEALDNNSIKTE